jgi:hypothetical protein
MNYWRNTKSPTAASLWLAFSNETTTNLHRHTTILFMHADNYGPKALFNGNPDTSMVTKTMIKPMPTWIDGNR